MEGKAGEQETFVEMVLGLAPAIEGLLWLAPCRKQQVSSGVRDGGENFLCEGAKRDSMLSLVFGEPHWIGDGISVNPGPSQPSNLAPPLPGENEKLYDGAIGVTVRIGMPPHSKYFLIGECPCPRWCRKPQARHGRVLDKAT